MAWDEQKLRIHDTAVMSAMIACVLNDIDRFLFCSVRLTGIRPQ